MSFLLLISCSSHYSHKRMLLSKNSTSLWLRPTNTVAHGKQDNVTVSSTMRTFLALTQNEASIYRIPLQHPTAIVKGLKAVAISLSELLKDVIIKHPLVCGTSLKAALSILQSITIRPKCR